MALQQLFLMLFSFVLFRTYESKLIELSCEEIHEAVDGHNSRRLLLANGDVGGQPPATNMKYMVWDEELALKASEWASNNLFSHNPDRSVASGRFQTGENIYYYSTTDSNYQFKIDAGIESWFSEHMDYTFGDISDDDFISPDRQVGHYTQMAWADSLFLGCGLSKYGDDGWITFLLVCNYGPAGNIIGQPPYETNDVGSGDLYCGPNVDCDMKYGYYC